VAWQKEIRGMPVVSVGEGKELGRVDALLVDPDEARVRWLRLAKGGFFGETRVIAMRAIEAIGENAITVDSEASAVRIDEVAEAQEMARDKRRLIGNRVLTDKGRLLGEIHDYELDEDTFHIIQYEIGKGDLLGSQAYYIAAERILTIGPDAVLVESGAEEDLPRAAEEPVARDEVEAPDEAAPGWALRSDTADEPADDETPGGGGQSRFT
jgi:uncharacterized protein YrrD